ncbi:MAG: SURF1 family cytochrome oxidase biogenesis protein [Acidimicrobiales bacterium]
MVGAPRPGVGGAGGDDHRVSGSLPVVGQEARNRLYDERAAQPVEAVDAVVPLDATAERVEEVRFRLLAATGTYRPDEEVFVRSRSLDGQPGAWVLTPLALQGRPGEAVVVNRGWIPSADTTRSRPPGPRPRPGR